MAYKGPALAENVTKVTRKLLEEIAESVENGINGQNMGLGENALKELQALPFSAERGVHSSNTAFGWHALEALTGLTGVFPPTAPTVVGNGVFNMTGVEGKAGAIYAGGTSATPMIVFRKLPAGVTNPKVNQAYFVVSGTANAFSISETHGGAPVLVAGAEVTAGGTEIALLHSTEDNTAIGSQAGLRITTGGGNTLVGENSGVNLTSGEENTVVGCEALAAQQTTSNNVAVGFRAANQNTTGTGITAIGNQVLEEATAATESVAVGTKAMQEATGTKNTAVGFEALKKGTGAGNTALGNGALNKLTNGGSNVAVGLFAGQATTTGAENVFVGTDAGIANTTGAKNVGVGNEALAAMAGGERNVALGYSAGEKLTGKENVLLGHKAGKTLTATDKKLVIANNETLALIEGKMSATAAEQELAFYGVTPVKRAAAIASPAETLAALKTAVDALRVAVKNIGITE